MRNSCEVLIDEQGVYLAIGIDRSDVDVARFVRLDLNKNTLLIGPKGARNLAALLRKYADQADTNARKFPHTR